MKGKGKKAKEVMGSCCWWQWQTDPRYLPMMKLSAVLWQEKCLTAASAMPLDGHAFLVNQGWSGTGTALRKGAISRPVTAPQKRNLAGIGKDRDEAFPFWDQ